MASAHDGRSEEYGSGPIELEVNGSLATVDAPRIRRLSDVLREDLGLLGTKVGCEAGDCGACTVLLDGEQVCACLVALGRAQGRRVETVEGLVADGVPNALQRAFHAHGAAQCGICTPGMLMAATDLLRRRPSPTREQVLDGLAGVLCRCTGYLEIVDAVLAAAAGKAVAARVRGAVGARLPKVDGLAKVTGVERFAADGAPAGCLWLHVVRSPHARAHFRIPDAGAPLARAGIVRVLTAADVTVNRFGIYPEIKDQPVLADGGVRYRGEAVAAVIGEPAAIAGFRDSELPIEWEPLEGLDGIEAALAEGAPSVQAAFPDNVLTRGRLRAGDVDAAFAAAARVVTGRFRTRCVEHAYIEPEAGWARRVGQRLEIAVTTQAPYMDRDETARVLGLDPGQVRIVPTACGGGFGGKLDLSVQPLVGLAAWLLERPVRAVYTRPESMASSTKRHPAEMRARAACDGDGRLLAYEFDARFDTGAYSSWGPTVADRVPVHCAGPYRVPNVRADTAAVLTNRPPSGAFRGFGVPQAAIAHEALMDALAAARDEDPLEFRLRNALRIGDATPSGQVLSASAGLARCVEAARARWREWRGEAEAANREASASGAPSRRGVGIGCMWYGCGNTSMSNPSTIEVRVGRGGAVTLYTGAVDIGQGANTILVQIAADAIGIPVERIGYVMGDTDRTRDAGKSSASRQTLVSGRAAQLAGEGLRREILRLTNASVGSLVEIGAGEVTVRDAGRTHRIDLAALPDLALDREADEVLAGIGTYDPPTTPLDADGQGVPYAAYGFAAQIAEVEVDLELGTVRPRRILAAHDVGRAINPTQVEGQIHGGIAQGIGLALMEEYVPGRTENLHDYLMPTVGDVPPIEVVIIEEPEPAGPYGAKGIGEPALIPTAPAILGAIWHATGVRIDEVPATPGRVRAALLAAGVGARGERDA